MLIKDKIPYNVEKDFTYLYGMAAQPNIWLVHPSVPANTMAELIAWLKANPETPYATSGPGTTQHLCGEMLADAAGLKMTPVSYRASNLSIQDLIGGQIKLACDNFAVAYEQVKAGKLRAVSITSPEPYPLATEIAPTAATVPGFELMPAFGWVGPANMPPDIVKKLTEELDRGRQDPRSPHRTGKVRRAADRAAGACLRRCAHEGACRLRTCDRAGRHQGPLKRQQSRRRRWTVLPEEARNRQSDGKVFGHRRH